MSKPALRYLALGFLVSAIILAGYRSFLYQPQVADSSESDTAPLTQDELTYKEKYETLLAETELAQLENGYVDESESTENTESAASDEAAQESSESDTEESQEDSEDVATATVVINQGDPSSTAARQLQEQGIIEDSAEFDEFLESNNLSNLVRPGSFTVNSDMSFQEIADILLSES
ncbi:endolytic transglycosylase MltG [Desemzia sp. C1]|uniref:endolytic transglycosylase MltG n=1 Tax=Desemzia sp. C1 TaxID=2892016 RepID=UPI001E36FBA7|nr:endolytic transglycosylase MltG [Desemzia sp. C1]MCI3029940.1 endolytic transglycosylase MltG [Desemzia sp. C1]